MTHFPEIFRNAEVGDYVFNPDNGWGILIGINREKKEVTISVRDGLLIVSCCFDGRKDNTHIAPTFWPERFLPQYYRGLFPAPKKLVKKVVEMWVNIYPDQLFSFKSEEDANKSANLKRRLGSACHVVHEYFEEE